MWENIDAVKLYVKSVEIDNNGAKSFLMFLLLRLIENGSLTLRKLIKHKIPVYFMEKRLYLEKCVDEKSYKAIHSFINFKSKPFVLNSDLILLRMLRMLSLIFGDFKTFCFELSKLKKSKDEIDYIFSKDFIHPLVKEFHIATAKGNDIYYSKRIYQDSYFETLFPRIDLLGIDFEISLAWGIQRQYDGSNSYFENSNVYPNQNITIYDEKKSNLQISESKIFEAIETIINEYNKKGWLKMENIIM